MQRLILSFLLIFLSFTPTFAGDFPEELDGLTPAEWTEKIITEIEAADAKDMPYWGEDYPLNRLYAKLSYSTVGEVPERLEAYLSAVEKSTSIRHKRIASDLRSTFYDYEEKTKYPVSDDWFILSQNIAEQAIRDKGDDLSLLSTLELLMKNHEDDPAYPLARIIFHHMHSLAAGNRVDLPEALYHFKEVIRWTKYYYPEKQWPSQTIPAMHNAHSLTFNHKSGQKLLEYAARFPTDHEIVNMFNMTKLAYKELQYGDFEKAYYYINTVTPFKESRHYTFYVSAYAMIAAANGDKEVATEKIREYEKLDKKFYISRGPIFINAARVILDLDSPSESNLRNIIELTMAFQHVKRDELLNAINPAPTLNPEVSTLRLNDGVSDIFFAGRPVSSQKLDKITESNFELIQTTIEALETQKSVLVSDKEAALVRYFHDLMGKAKIPATDYSKVITEIGMSDFLEQMQAPKGEEISSAHGLLASAITAWQNNNLQTAWELIPEIRDQNQEISKYQKARNLIINELEIDLLSAENNTEELFQKSLQLLGDKTLSRLSTEETISSVLAALASAYEGRGQVFLARRILSLDPRLADQTEMLPFHNLFLAGWLAILSEDWSSAITIIPVIDKAADSVEEELLAQSLQYIIAPKSDKVVDPENIKTTILSVLDTKSVSISRDELLYYMAYGDIINTSEQNQVLLEKRTNIWNTIARKRSETLRALQSKASHDHNIAKTAQYNKDVTALTNTLENSQVKNIWSTLLAALALIAFGTYFLKYRRAEKITTQIRINTDQLSDRQSVFVHYINDIQTINDRSRSSAMENLSSLERGISDLKSLETVSLMGSQLRQWAREISMSVFSAKYLAADRFGFEDEINFPSFIKTAKKRWNRYGRRSLSSLSYSSSQIPLHFISDKFLIDTILDLFIEDALTRNPHRTVNVHFKQVTEGKELLLKATITENGNRPEILDEISQSPATMADDELHKGFESANAIKMAIALQTLKKVGGKFHQTVKGELPENSLELFLPVRALNHKAQAANMNYSDIENYSNSNEPS